MMIRKLTSNNEGNATIEMAFALPVLIMVMIGVLQYAIVAQTTSGMRHAIGEAVRFAKVFPNADEDEVLQVARDRFVGMDSSGITGLRLERGTAANGAEFGTVTMRYRLEPVVPFMSLTEINLQESRTAYLQATD
jgi:Flp pilus assembly protein TadG